MGWRDEGEERRKPRPANLLESSVVVGAFAVFGDVEAFALCFLGGTQADGLVDR
jgi:hypothetical protein